VAKPTTPPRTRRGPGRPPDVVGEDTKAAIIQAALRLFATHGYFSTTTRMIANEVGITPAALHHYFGRKRDLTIAVWTATMDEGFGRIQAATDEPDTFVGKVEALFDTMHRQILEDRDWSVFWFSMRDQAGRSPELSEILEDERIMQLIRSIARFGVKTGEIAPQDERVVGALISAMALGVTSLATDLSPRGMEPLFDACGRLFAGNLFPHE
jgi:AcrR family transcriptional regulator